MTLDETTRTELIREVALAIIKKQRLAFASDFHAFAAGRRLTLAGVTFDDFPHGPNRLFLPNPHNCKISSGVGHPLGALRALQ